MTASSLTSKWRGESERLVRLLFEMARYHAPSVIFFDEIDALAGARGGSNEHEASRRVKTELLVQMDGVASSLQPRGDADGGDSVAVPQVVVLAASNLPWELDDAIRRRLEKRIYIPLPGQDDRAALLRGCLAGIELALDVDLAALAAATAGFSGADIATLCRTAAMMPLRKLLEVARGGAGAGGSGGVDAVRRALAESGITDGRGVAALQMQVERKHFDDALAGTRPSVSAADARRFEQWMAEYGSV